MGKLDGKVALITAAAKGIGLKSAETLARNGATVYIADVNEELGNREVKRLNEQGFKAKFIKFDAFKEESYTYIVNTVIKNELHLDILVNNFGITNVKLDKDLVNGDTDEFFKVVKTNLQSVYLTCKLAIPTMIKNGGGSIVNISSIGSKVPDLSRIAYCISKASINALTENIAVQYAKYNIRCNAILPGMIGTDALMNNMTDEFMKSFLAHVPLNRIGKPEDIANAVLFCASSDSSFVTGQKLEVTGGYAMATPQYAEYSNMNK